MKVSTANNKKKICRNGMETRKLHISIEQKKMEKVQMYLIDDSDNI